MRVLFLQLAHPETDDRIRHQMKTLRKQGHTCAYARARSKDDAADVIICDTPKAVLRNTGHRGMVLYDVTEWYPSKKNLRPYHPLLRPLAATYMLILSLLAGVVADRFIFGEEYKAKPFRCLFPWKKYVYLPYYPSQKLFADVVDKPEPHSHLRVLYVGPLTEEKGYFRAVRAAEQAGVELTVIGPEQYMPLEEFCHYIRHFDVALDLRDRDVENRHCLPIKLFYYWAAGVVPIFSDQDAIRLHIHDTERAMYLVRNEEDTVAALRALKDNRELLTKMRLQGRWLHHTRYYWEAAEERLTSIISQM